VVAPVVIRLVIERVPDALYCGKRDMSVGAVSYRAGCRGCVRTRNAPGLLLGKFAIHPRQVPIINAAFGPTSDEVAWATRVVASFDVAGSGVLMVDGVMIDRPTVEQARNILGRKNDLGLP